MKKILLSIGLVTVLVLNIFITFADNTSIQAPADRESEDSGGGGIQEMGKICYNGSMITGSVGDICNDCHDCNYYFGRVCIGTKGYCQ